MAKNATWSTATRNAKLDAIRANFNSGYIRIYTGAQPAGPDTAISTQALLAELRCSATAAPVASAGALTFNAITSDASADSTGTAAWFRVLMSDGATALHDGTAGVSAANAILNSTAIVAGAIVSCSSLVITDAAASAL